MRILLACVITVVVETAIFMTAGYRRNDDALIVALANVVTNLTLNLFLTFVPAAARSPWILILELLVVAVEYLIYRAAFSGSLKLFILTFAANAATYLIGVLLQGVLI